MTDYSELHYHYFRSTMADAAARLTLVRTDTTDTEQMLTAIVAGALQAVPAAAGASVTLVDRAGALSTHAPSDDRVSEVDQLQADLREGPCIDALAELGDPVTDASDLWADPPWPFFARAAIEAGFCAVLSFQLRAGSSAGALNLYGHDPHCFTSRDRLVGALFANQAAVALAGARRVGDLNRALLTRDVIARAKGILMERLRIDDARAFALLVDSSQHTNMKLHDVAAWLVHEAEARYAEEKPETDTPATERPLS